MGIFTKRGRDILLASAQPAPLQLPVTGLFTPSTLPLSIFHDVDNTAFPVNVGEAMAVPAVSRGIQLISTASSAVPFVGPEWLNYTQGVVTPQLRLVQTVQDLIFHNASVWGVSRDADGFVNYAERIERERWSVDADGNIIVDGKVAKSSDVVYIAGILPLGFLDAGRDSVRHYTSIARTINNRTAVPEPVTLIKSTEQDAATEEEIDTMMDNYALVREGRTGGQVYVPYGLDVVPYGLSDSTNALMIQAREAVRKDVANHMGINVNMLDGSNGQNMVYENSLQTRNEFIELTLKTWLDPIAARFSQDDITPPGVTVYFDYSVFAPEDAKGNTGNAVDSPDEKIEQIVENNG